ncbi:alpha/beta fold hydrolase [Kitasatospora sp. NPDC089797]|uniref:thioesterase II family protein n=1 Tax=Kitasatospora sp. NPDC089797 TaxID=3155298 RepID=UPI003427CD1C
MFRPPDGLCNRGRSPVAQPLERPGGQLGEYPGIRPIEQPLARLLADPPAHPAVAEPGPDDGPITLLGLHPAGGSTAFFAGWQRALGERATVVPVRLPGRDATGGHCRAGLPSLVAALERDLGPLLDRPHLLYGHSMGALLAHRLTLRRAAQGRRLPERLLLGAYPAPHLPHPLHREVGLADAELVRRLVDFGALPESLRADTRWLADRIALVRAEIGLCGEVSGRSERRPLPCPIEVFSGIDDPLVTAAGAAAWAEHAGGGFHLHRLPGGHFFPRESPESKDAFFRCLTGLIAPLATV